MLGNWCRGVVSLILAYVCDISTESPLFDYVPIIYEFFDIFTDDRLDLSPEHDIVFSCILSWAPIIFHVTILYRSCRD